MDSQQFTLSELNNYVKQSIEMCMPDSYWIKAELSDVRLNNNGHCYLEFIEKDANTNHIVAKAKGTIWSNQYHTLNKKFLSSTKSDIKSGLKVLVKVVVTFHELYGYSLNVIDIDPNYTLGELVTKRTEILIRLEKEGIIDLNKELIMPVFPKRVAIISSKTAAGYDDFCHQIYSNNSNLNFHLTLFDVVMQGNMAEETILQALEEINNRYEEFDVIVIIRGGGATSELNCFDTYLLAAAITQMPLPVISGIGHERDYTVIDYVAHTRAKTPTAAAEILINKGEECLYNLSIIKDRIKEKITQRLYLERTNIEKIRIHLPIKINSHTDRQRTILKEIKTSLRNNTDIAIKKATYSIQLIKQRLEDLSPEKQLARGYTITKIGDRILMPNDDINKGDKVEIISSNRVITSVIDEVKERKTK